MKKLLTLIAILAISMSVCACSGDKAETTGSSGSDTPAQSQNSGLSSDSPTSSSDESDIGSTPATGSETEDSSTPTTPATTTTAGTPEVVDPDDEGWSDLFPVG